MLIAGRVKKLLNAPNVPIQDITTKVGGVPAALRCAVSNAAPTIDGNEIRAAVEAAIVAGRLHDEPAAGPDQLNQLVTPMSQWQRSV